MDFYVDLDEDLFEAPKPEKVRLSAAEKMMQWKLAMERKRLEAKRNFEEWWQLKPVRTPSEVLSTLAKVQIVLFLHDWDTLSPLRRTEKELGYIASCHSRNDEKELMKHVKTESYLLTFGKCTDVQAAAMLAAFNSGPLEFRDHAPLELIQRACKDYLAGAGPAGDIRDITCTFSSSSVTDGDVLPTDVCAEVYGTLFPCHRCSAPHTLQQVFHHKGVNGRQVRYELCFSCWDDRDVVRENRTLHALHDISGENFAHVKSVLSQAKISASIPDCTVANDLTADRRTLLALFTVYAIDVFAYLDRNALDRSELVSFTWHKILSKMHASLTRRCLCVELVMALDGTWVVPIIYNPVLDGFLVDRRQFKLPHRSAELGSQLMRGHLRNALVASIVVTHESGEEMPDASSEAIRWVCEMLAGLDECHIGELHVTQVDPRFEGVATAFDRAMRRNRPQQLSMSFNSDERFRQVITLDGFLLDGALRSIEEIQFSVASSQGSVVPAWKQILFLTPCVRKLGIHYAINESAQASGLRYVADDIIKDFLSLDDMGAAVTFDFFLSACRPVPFLRGNHVSSNTDVQVMDAPWWQIGAFACEEFRFRNDNCHKELIVYTSVTDHESVVLCRFQ
ncbi:hypothetical protein AAVH_28037 [Aphelenchoides avenae]|nr:hypothetical protein AAVH_28037 [Aphelenchus avenae]